MDTYANAPDFGSPVLPAEWRDMSVKEIEAEQARERTCSVCAGTTDHRIETCSSQCADELRAHAA
jgi:ribosomal protein L37AE/L43A